MDTQSPGADARGRRPPNHVRLPSFSSILSETGHQGFPFARRNSSSSSPSVPPATQADPFFPPQREPVRQQHRLTFSVSRDDRTMGPRYGDMSQFIAVNEINTKGEDLHTATAGNTFPFPDRLLPSAQFRNAGAPASPEAGQTRNFLREETIPGKGLCFIYDDGATCQKSINGDTVNPKWGTTKAGKPRKRLGQACNTCREKKIKCDPNVPKCAQCDKFGRECKFETNARTSHKSPGTSSSRASPSDSDAGRERRAGRTGSIASPETQQDPLNSRDESRSSMNVDSLLSPSSIEEAEDSESHENPRPSKKARFSTSPRSGGPLQSSILNSDATPELPSRLRAVFSIEIDPFEVDENLASHYLSKYFAQMNVGAWYMLPQRQFTAWARSSKNKSLSDKMLLYAILALGSIFAEGQHRLVTRQRFAEIAVDALAKSPGTLALQIVQTRLILALLHISSNQLGAAWELCGAAIRTACSMRLNVEEDLFWSTTVHQPCYEFDPTTFVECKRRTFWAAYLFDCFNGCYRADVSSTHTLDGLLRLPCPDRMYEADQIPRTLYFYEVPFGGIQLSRDDHSKLDRMAFSIQISAIFNQIVAHISRSMPPEMYDSSYEIFYRETMNSLQLWEKAVTNHCELHPLKGKSRPPIPSLQKTGLLMLYHYGAILLHRHVRHDHLRSPSISHNCQMSWSHARRLLMQLQQLVNQETHNNVPATKFAITSPMMGHAVLLAVDTLTAAGTMSSVLDADGENMMSLVRCGIVALEKLAEYWETAKEQLRLIKVRVDTLLTASNGVSSRKIAFFIREPLQSSFSRDQDLVYGMERLKYLQNLVGTRVKDETDIYEIGGQVAN